MKRLFRFITAKRVASENAKWYQLSPRTFTIVALVIIVPELILQLASFSAWYFPRHDDSPSVLCIADYETTYPSILQDRIQKANLKWKVIQETSPLINVSSAQTIIDSYRKTRHPDLVYLSIGMSDIRPSAPDQPPLVWDDSFEWKWRTPELGSFLATGNFKPVISSEKFRKPAGNETHRKKPQTSQTGSSPAYSAKTDEQSQTSSENSQKPDAYENPKLKQLLSMQYPETTQDFPVENWTSDCFSMNFSRDGNVLLGNRKVKWSVEGSRLQIETGERPIEFHWRLQGEQLLLMSDVSPMSLVMTKGKTVTKHSSRALFALGRSWFKMITDELEEAEQMLNEAALACADDPAVHALKVRLYEKSDRTDQAKTELAWLKDDYKRFPDQRSAESLYFSMSGESDEEKATVAVELLSKYPLSARLWATLGEYAAQSGNEIFGRQAVDHALGLLPDYLQRTRMLIMRNSNMRSVPRQGMTGVNPNVLAMQVQNSLGREEMLKTLEKAQQVVHQELVALLRGVPAKNPQVVLVPYTDFWMMNRIMEEIATSEKISMVDAQKVRQQIQLKNRTDHRFKSPEEIQEESQAIAAIVLDDFGSRLQYLKDAAGD